MKYAVLLSGGVDSSVALKLLQEQGHDVTAFYLKIWLDDELSFLGSCPWEEDLSYARAVCEQLNVPLEIVSLQRQYWDRVVSFVIDAIKSGRTPNPDILCNQRVKFGAFYDVIGDEYQKVATGHYAGVEYNEETGLYELHRAPDPIKDQTYFLSYISQEQLSRACFPLGDLAKADVRRLAHEYALPTCQRKDSQGVCFLGKIKFRDFIAYHVGEKTGDLVEFETNKVVGQHKGFWFYTLGQRQGIGLSGGPWYVVAKNTQTNTVYISRNYYTPDKIRDTFTIGSCNWIAGSAPEDLDTQDLYVKLRHGEKQYACSVTENASAGKNTYTINLAENDQGIAPGQYAVLYNGTTCLGGGVIQE